MYKVGDRVLVEAEVVETNPSSLRLQIKSFLTPQWTDRDNIHGLAPEKPLAVGDRVKAKGGHILIDGSIKYRIDDHVWVRWAGVHSGCNLIHHVESLTRIKGDS